MICAIRGIVVGVEKTPGRDRVEVRWNDDHGNALTCVLWINHGSLKWGDRVLLSRTHNNEDMRVLCVLSYPA